MVLLASTCLSEKLKEGEDVEEIDCYRLAFGVYHKLILLKLSMNFMWLCSLNCTVMLLTRLIM